MIRSTGFLIALLVAAPVNAQTPPPLPGGDTRLKSVVYDAERVVSLRVPLGYQTTIVLDPQEQVETVAVGDSGTWQVTPNARGDHLFVKPLATGQATNLTVVTTARLYVFELIAAPTASADTPFTVRFQYPAAVTADAARNTLPLTEYRLTGSRRLQPLLVTDDGSRTFIDWSPGQALPAVFAVDDQNREILVTGYMREGRFVIDAVYPALLFRSDRQAARATRSEAAVR